MADDRHFQPEARLPQRDRVTCYVSHFVLCYTTTMGVIKASNSKSDLRGHWRQSTDHIQFAVSLTLQLCRYLALFLRYYHLFSKI